MVRQHGTNSGDLVMRPGSAGVKAATQALEWAETKRRSTAIGSEPVELRIGRRLQSTELVDLLQARGYERRSVGVPAMSRTIATADVDQGSIPSGYAIRELHTDDLASRVVAFNAAFKGEELCVDAYQALRDCSPYVPRLDVVATSSSSSVAAFATLWLDPRNAVVQIEPAGCHPDHRRLGLTRAVILQAWRYRGARSARQHQRRRSIALRIVWIHDGLRADRLRQDDSVDGHPIAHNHTHQRRLHPLRYGTSSVRRGDQNDGGPGSLVFVPVASCDHGVVGDRGVRRGQDAGSHL